MWPMRTHDYRHRRMQVSPAFSLMVEDAPVETAAADLPATAHWAGVIAVEGEMTGDGRLIEPGALSWNLADETVQFRYVRQDVGEHAGAEVAGNVLRIQRRDGGVIWGEGDFDMTTAAGRDAYVAVRDGRQDGVSMDLDSVSFELRVAAELVASWDEPISDEPPPANADGTVTLMKISADDEVMVTTSARIRAVTDVGIPAFATARIAVVDGPEDDDDDATPPGSDELAAHILAAAAPVAPPTAWFENPNLSEPTALQITKDGRVFGHMALWGTCHISHTAGGKCVTPPNSPSDYAWFHTGAVLSADDTLIAVGHLTMGTGHAAENLTALQAASHYDNTGTAAADVRAYEDQFGIVVAGALRPNLTPEQVRTFRAAPLSGDWRMVGGALEMVASLSVNVPGFGVPRPHGFIKADRLESLVAAGVVQTVTDDVIDTLTASDVAYLRGLIARGKREEVAALAARRNKVKVDAFARRRNGG